MKPSPKVCQQLNRIGELDDNELGLTETALILARSERPGTDTNVYERHLEKLINDVAAYAGSDANNEKIGLQIRIEALQQVIAKRFGYGGSEDAYENFECVNLMRVIDRRDGLPTQLGIIYIHVARALGWTIVGLDFPPRFLVRLEYYGQRKILDPFDGGRILEPFNLRKMFKDVSGPHTEITPEHLKTMTNRDIILRSQRNAKALHLRSDDFEQALDVVETLLLVAPKNPALWREAGILNARMDRPKEAIIALENFLKKANDQTPRYRASVLLQELRGRLNQIKPI